MTSQKLKKRYCLPALMCSLLCIGILLYVVFYRFSLGTISDRIVVFISFIVIYGFSLWIIWNRFQSLNLLLIMTLPLSVAILIRSFCMDYVTDDYISFLSPWVEFFRNNGGFSAIAFDVGDYNVPYLYFIAAISYLKIPDLYLYKLLSVFFDVLLAWGAMELMGALCIHKRKTEILIITFTCILFLPTVVANGSLWGQCDSLYAGFVVFALAFLMKDRPKWSVVFMAIAFSFKLQTIFVLPLWLVMWIAKRIKLKDFLLFPATYLITALPAVVLGKPFKDILGVYFNQMGEYSRLTLNAPSVYQFIPYQKSVNETMLSRIGIMCSIFLVMALIIIGIIFRKSLDGQIFLTMALIFAIGVPFFLPHMHERYFFLADVISLCWAALNWKRLPIAGLVSASSLLSYLVYFRLKYNYVVRIGGNQYVMGLEAFAMMLALLFTVLILFFQIRRINGKSRNTVQWKENSVGLKS